MAAALLLVLCLHWLPCACLAAHSALPKRGAAFGRKQGVAVPLADAGDCAGFPAARAGCCTMYLAQPDMELGLTWGGLSVHGQDRWGSLKCDKLRNKLLHARNTFRSRQFHSSLNDMKAALELARQAFFLAEDTLLHIALGRDFTVPGQLASDTVRRVTLGTFADQLRPGIAAAIVASGHFKLLKASGRDEDSRMLAFTHHLGMEIDVYVYYPLGGQQYYAASFDGMCGDKPGGFCRVQYPVRGLGHVAFHGENYPAPANTKEYLVAFRHFLPCLRDMKAALDRARQPFFLTDGTLLGAVREQDFILHDHDVDLAIFADQLRPGIAAAIVASGHFKLLKDSGNEDSRSLAFAHHLGMKIDVYVYYPLGGQQYYCAIECSAEPGGFCRFQYPVRGLDHIVIHGENYPVPANTKEYLVAAYGEGWETPHDFTFAEGMSGAFKAKLSATVVPA
jgi:hypothetical protein